MPDEPFSSLSSVLFRPHHIGDPAVLLDTILREVEGEQAKQVLTHYLDAVSAALDANQKFVQGVRSVIAGGAKR